MSTALKIGVIIGYIAIISFIATYLGKGTKTFKDFAIGGSRIPGTSWAVRYFPLSAAARQWSPTSATSTRRD